MAETWPARTVVVEKSFGARCTFCEWEGPMRKTFAEAADDRVTHLDWHRAGATARDTPPLPSRTTPTAHR